MNDDTTTTSVCEKQIVANEDTNPSIKTPTTIAIISAYCIVILFFV